MTGVSSVTKRGSTTISIDMSGPVFLLGGDSQLVFRTLHKRIEDMGDIALDLAVSAWSDKGRYVSTLGKFPSEDKLFTIVRSRWWGRPYPQNATAEAAGGPLLSWWLEKGMRGGVKLRRGTVRWQRTGAAIKALDQQAWFADAVADVLNG